VRVPGLAGADGAVLGVGLGSAAKASEYVAKIPPSVSAAISTAFAALGRFGAAAGSICDHLP
jgi:hypothetical protein